MLAHRVLLMRLGLLESLSEEQISAIQERLKRRWLEPGEVLFKQGERCEHLHLIQDGSIQLLAEQKDGRHTLDIVTEGHVLGEVGVFMSLAYPCTAEAAQKSLVASLHRDDLRRMTNDLPGFGWQLLRLLSRRLIGMQVRVQALSSPDVRVRIGTVILQLAQETADPLRGGSVTMRVNQAEIGQMSGVARETVSRLLVEWSKEGLITVGRGRLSIPDLARFQAMLEEQSGSDMSASGLNSQQG